MSLPKIRTAVVASAFALGLAANAGAAQLVTFTRGHSIVVQAVEKRGNWYYFTLEGGGEMGVPVKQVASMEEYELPPSSPAQTPDASAPPRAAASAPPPAVAPAAMGSNVPGSPPSEGSEGNGVDPAAPPAPSADGVGAVDPNGEQDWRSRVKMGGGGARSQAGAKGKGPVGAWGAGRPPGGTNPLNRRPPNKPQQPVPPQQ